MVSLLKLTKLTEEGVTFNSPHDGSLMLLSPEHSMALQNSIGADIIMQLDDVVATTCPDSTRMQQAMDRSVRWLDRCIASHKRPNDQALFCIIQGGLDLELRTKCMDSMVCRNTPGIAIGGLSGGEDKNSFWRVVKHCSDHLSSLGKPLYCMGVGYAIDLVVCTALGIDMFDCVFPTRTARFGNALIRSNPGKLSLGNAVFADDSRVIEEHCKCVACSSGISRAYLHGLMSAKETVGCHLISLHNLQFQLDLMKDMREAIKTDTFPTFVKTFLINLYESIGNIPQWVSEALSSVNINILKE